jgi:hypothetical protein
LSATAEQTRCGALHKTTLTCVTARPTMPPSTERISAKNTRFSFAVVVCCVCSDKGVFLKRCPSAEECTNCVVRLPGEQFLYSVEQSGFRLFAGGSRGVVSVVDVRNPSRAAEEMVLSEQQQMKYVTGMCFAEDGRELLVSLGGRRAEIVMVKNKEENGKERQELNEVLFLRYGATTGQRF